MKRTSKMISLVALAFATLTSFTMPSIYYFRVFMEGGQIVKKENIPHRVPRVNYSIVAQYSNTDQILSLMFFVGSKDMTIEIIKDDSVISFESRHVNNGDVLSYDMSEYGSGAYMIHVICDDNNEYIGNFEL